MARFFAAPKNSNDVLIVQDVADVAKARAWLGGADLKAAMEKAGVIGPPSFHFMA